MIHRPNLVKRLAEVYPEHKRELFTKPALFFFSLGTILDAIDKYMSSSFGLPR